MKKELKNVTLLGVDCVDIDRLIQVAEICMNDFEFGEVKLLTSLQSNNKHIVKIDPINRTLDYSKFIIKNLDKYVDTDFVLVIQYDGFILNSDSWTDEFLKYDYMGAPIYLTEWAVKHFGVPRESLGKCVVGNGGFSLRSKTLLSLCAKMDSEGEFGKYDPEDIVLCFFNQKSLENNGIRFAPIELAHKFSKVGCREEGISWTGQFGFHGLDRTDISEWVAKHPEYKIENKLAEWAIKEQVSNPDKNYLI